MKDADMILTRYFKLLEQPFSRGWISNFKSMMEFIQSNPETNRIVQAIQEEKIEDHQSLIQNLEHLLKDGRENLKRLLMQSQNTIGIDGVTGYLKEIHDSENRFHKDCMDNLRREQERVQKRLSQMYDDKLDGLIDEAMYLDKVRVYKARQAEILEEMGRHHDADENFYVTANMVMNLAARSKEIFLSSEVAEKRQFLNLVFQNLQLNDQKNLILEVKEPFMTLMGIKNGSIRPIDCR